jgi:CHAD domain-containing protein
VTKHTDPEHQPAGRVVTEHLRRHLDALVEQEIRIRAAKPSAVNKVRVEARRLRATLTTYGTVFAPGSVDQLRDELQWIGRALGATRDAQVLRQRIAALVSADPDRQAVAVLGHQIDARLEHESEGGRVEVLTTLDGDRYRQLTSALRSFILDPALGADAARPAAHVVPQAIHRDADRLERSVRRATDKAPGDERDAAFHTARKRAKQLRYAAEAAVPAFGHRAKRVLRGAQSVQNLLGERQDAAICRTLLLQYAAEPGIAPGTVEVLEWLAAVEASRRDEHEAAFLHRWSDGGLVLTLR